MSAPLSAWRTTYTAGDWIVLSGPTSVVVLQPGDGTSSELVTTLWTEVLASSSITDLATQLAVHGIDETPSFAAFFWTADGMRSLVRGIVSVMDLTDGRIIADGAGVQTWSEVGLGDVKQVRVDMQAAGAQDPTELPLVVGAVRASSIVLDARPESRVSSPQHWGQASFEPEMLDQRERQLEPQREVLPSEVATEEMLPGGDGEVWMQWDPEEGDTALMALLPEPDPEPPVPADPHDDLDDGEERVLAVTCSQGHPSPPSALACRVCGADVPAQDPRLVTRPRLASLRGPLVTLGLDRTVLIGRAPSAEQAAEADARMMTVPSPTQDISRTHLQVAVDGWDILVTDLHSTNGTTVVPPGAGPDFQRLVPGEPVAVEVGTVIALGDGVVDPPA